MAKYQFWKPLALRLPILLSLLFLGTALVAFLEVANHRLAHVESGFTVNLTTSTFSCFPGGEVDCPSDSQFEVRGDSCYCSTLTIQNSPYIFVNWTDLPNLPLFSQDDNEVSGWLYFFTSYFPALVSVIYSVLWNTVDIEIKKLQPYMDMARPEGSNIKTIYFNYLDKNTFLVPYYALKNRHRLVLIASLIDISATALAPILVATFELQVFQVLVDGGQAFGRAPSIQKPFLRVAQALLLFMFVLNLFLIFMLARKPSPVYSDPTSIAHLVSLANQTVLDPFQAAIRSNHDSELPDLSKEPEYLHLQLKLHHTTSEVDGSIHYQITTDIDIQSSNERARRNTTKPSKWALIRSTFNSMGLTLFISLGFIQTVALYLLFRRLPDAITRRTADPGTIDYRIPFIGTTVATVLKTLWVTIERGMASNLTILRIDEFETKINNAETRLKEPYRKLSKGGALSRKALLSTIASNPISAIFRAVSEKSFLVAWFTCSGLATELLTITIAPALAPAYAPYSYPGGGSVGLNDSMETINQITAWKIAVPVCIFTFVSYAAAVAYRIAAPKLPHRVSTTADLFSYICDSHMVHQFSDWSMLSANEREKRLLSTEKSYKLGKRKRTDESIWWAIDEEVYFHKD
ncbi:hypothetical protein K432DRAFT_410597 [Lepidopterella palustris CBS 459.81]|uniref:Uncharacterized protein n=1 Tax=Lepidopterella palustris CBS 459.81 TaxID=1314670 RepID=A0A8E2DXH1_9PEZI|nr:hypothetical protein K432DRAFT_410597 [Lepidopterella palustris CBS 459.81]